jgi:hypothetical protein
MKETKRIGVIAPVFACPEFEENTESKNYIIDKLYEPCHEEYKTHLETEANKFVDKWDKMKQDCHLEKTLKPVKVGFLFDNGEVRTFGDY